MITLVTGNPNKINSIRKYYPDFECNIVDIPQLEEIQSTSVRDVASRKAIDAYKHLEQGPVLVEDVSLSFDALHPMPGPFIKYFLGKNNEGLEQVCRMLNSFDDRGALNIVCYALYDGRKDLKPHLFSGVQYGKIAYEPRGTQRFGFDSVFIPRGCSKTCGEMNDNELAQVSARREALMKLQEHVEWMKQAS